MDNFDFYISSNGYLIIPEYNIRYLIDFNESNIPSMPEAAEATVTIAGRDGDVVLNTTYLPLSFTIVCYTNDDLSIQEKSSEEQKVNHFLNSIKNNTKTFGIEKDNKFYKVKYSGVMTTINFPKHLKFSIPLKSSQSYAMNMIEKSIIGNNSAISNTIENVGAIFTIQGPAQTPKISLNDYILEYTNIILDGAKLIINSKDSTAIHVNSNGVQTNAMRYYNYQFPKIKNGKNELKVLSGISDATKVNVKWHDLIL